MPHIASESDRPDVIILGGGPAGLTAAYELQRLCGSYRPTVLEAGDIVGGIARTENLDGYRFDIGGHRFFTKVSVVSDLWREILHQDFIRVQRLSRIYYNGKFFDYPLRPLNALSNLGALEAAKILASYGKAQLLPRRVEVSFEDWVINRFGKRLYQHFFESYTHKVWGIPPKMIRADWAAQRIKNLSLLKAVINALGLTRDSPASLIEQFDYPRLGPGMMWERASAIIEERGGNVLTQHRVVQLNREDDRIVSVGALNGQGSTAKQFKGEHFISSMALDDLLASISPAPPQHVMEAASKLRYRDFLIVTLVLDRDDPFPDNWIYVHSPNVKVGRIQNFRAWSQDMVPDANHASIGMEYFCNEGDDVWNMSNTELGQFAFRELTELGLADGCSAVKSTVIRQKKAYPIYDSEYQDAVAVISSWINGLKNLQTVGRNGMHRYNNQDHSMLTALLAARNINGEIHDLWSVNLERSYHEEFQLDSEG